MGKPRPLMALLVLLCAACARSPQSYVDKDNKLSAEGKYEDAVLNYRKAIQGDPNNGEAHYQLGLLLERAHKMQEAYQLLSRAVELLPNREDVKVKLGDLMLSSYLLDKRRPKTLHDKLVRLYNILRRRPGDEDAKAVKASLLAAKGKPHDVARAVTEL